MDPATAIAHSSPSELARLLGLNDTQAGLLSDYYFGQIQAVDDAETHIFVYNVVPFLLETFALGVVSIVALLLAYNHIREQSASKYIILLLALCVGTFATHWALAYRAITLFSPIDLNSILEMGEVICETALFGALTGLAFLASVLFKTRETSAPRRSNQILSRWLPFGTVIVMYIIAAAHWSISIWAGLQLASQDALAHEARYYQLSVASSVTLSLSVICSDVIVLWRACAVWLNRRVIVLLSALLILATAASSFANIALLTEETLDLTDHSPGILAVSPSASLNTIPGFASLGMSIFANCFATLAIFYKAWRHRTMVRKHLTEGSRRLMTEKIMSIFIESGAVYICLWILYVAGTLIPGDSTLTFHPYAYSMVQLTAIYPTLIIILVFLETKVYLAKDLTISAQLAAAHATIATIIHSAPNEILTIGREVVDAEQGRLESTTSRKSDEISSESEGSNERSL